MEKRKYHISGKDLVLLFVAVLGLGVGAALATAGSSAHLLAIQQSCSEGGEAVYQLSVQDAPEAVQAFGMVIRYNPLALKYTGTYEAGSLIRDFDFLLVNETAPGTIKIGGIKAEGTSITASSSGNLLTLHFQAKKCRKARVRIRSLVDDIAGWMVVYGKE